MPVPDLSSYKPVAATSGDANQVANGFQAVQDSLNAIGDATKTTWGSGKIFDVNKIKQGGATANQVMIWNGGTSEWTPTTITDLHTFYNKTSQKDVANTVAKTDLLNGEITIAANKLTANGLIKIIASGDYLNNSGATRTITLELKLGATVLWDSNASGNISATATRKAWSFTAYIQAMASTSAQRGGGFFVMGRATPVATTGTGGIEETLFGGPFLTAASTVDMTASRALTLSVTHSSAATTISMRLEHARVEVYA